MESRSSRTARHCPRTHRNRRSVGRNRSLCKKIPMKKYLILIVFGVFILSHPVRADMLNDQQVFFIDPQYDIAGRTQVTATMRAVMPHIYFYVTNDYWSGLSQEGQARLQILMNALGNEFENRIYPIETGFFGSEPNPRIENDPHITFV